MLAIVPVKGRDGKNRLESLLAPVERARLVEAMLADVLSACAAARSVTGSLVVTPDPDVAPGGVDVLTDEGTGHGDAVGRALADPRAAEGALVVMGDCPLALPEALDRLAGAARPAALARARDGGMNALAVRRPGAFEPAFGVADAASVTVERGRAAGVDVAVLDEASLAFDVDNPPDVWKLREHAERGRAHEALADMLPPTGGLL